MPQIIRPFELASYTGSRITQIAHGFSVGAQVYFDGLTWQPAQADAQATLRTATVAQVFDPDSFLIAFEGVMAWPAHGLTLGTTYYLSADTPGAVVNAPPVAAGSFAQPVLFPLDADNVRLIEYVILSGGTSRNVVSALIPSNTIPTPGAAGFRLRLVQLASTESTGTVHISWKRGNGTSWGGVVALTTFVTTNGGPGFSMKMLTGRFGWGTVQIVHDNGLAYLELVSDGSWSYQGGSRWDIFYTFASHLGNRGVILEPPVAATTGTVVSSIDDRYLNTLGSLDDVDVTGAL